VSKYVCVAILYEYNNDLYINEWECNIHAALPITYKTKRDSKKERDKKKKKRKRWTKSLAHSSKKKNKKMTILLVNVYPHIYRDIWEELCK
jgi:hypothetical protein